MYDTAGSRCKSQLIYAVHYSCLMLTLQLLHAVKLRCAMPVYHSCFVMNTTAVPCFIMYVSVVLCYNRFMLYATAASCSPSQLLLQHKGQLLLRNTAAVLSPDNSSCSYANIYRYDRPSCLQFACVLHSNFLETARRGLGGFCILRPSKKRLKVLVVLRSFRFNLHVLNRFV